ncbi:MAG: hypothetical protein RLZ98_1747 [Pseudomonadota bacterium]|jgi:BolA protein
MSIEQAIRRKLEENLSPSRLEIVNESHLHAGHHGSPGTGESHFRVLVVSAAFEGRSRLQRHRLINEAVAEQLRDGVHALAIKALTPAEDSP